MFSKASSCHTAETADDISVEPFDVENDGMSGVTASFDEVIESRCCRFMPGQGKFTVTEIINFLMGWCIQYGLCHRGFSVTLAHVKKSFPLA